MSEYGFGYYDGDQGEGPAAEEQVQQQGPKWFRDYMDKVSSQLKTLQQENESLRQEKSRTEVADTLKAKGFDPSAATLYQGEPKGLDDWLKTYGNALAKLPAAPGEEGVEGEQTPAGPPASTVPADGQAQMRLMQEAGTQGVAPPQGSDKELAAALGAANSMEELAQLMKAQGNPYSWS